MSGVVVVCPVVIHLRKQLCSEQGGCMVLWQAARVAEAV